MQTRAAAPRFEGKRVKWTEAEDKRLATLWAEDHSMAQIGRRMGRSKNSIVGRARRQKLPARPSPIRRAAGARKPDRTANSPAMPAGKLLKVEAAALRGRGSDAGSRALPAGALLKVAAPSGPAVRTGPVTTCCFPLGEPRTPGFRFCGAAAMEGRPYCEAHCKVAYVPLSKWRWQNGVSKADASDEVPVR